MIWLCGHTREQLYPYSTHPQLYTDNYTLLSQHGRIRSYIGFASKVNFDVRLYPSDLYTHFLYVIEHPPYNVPPVNKRGQRLPIPTNRLNVLPDLDYSYADNRIRAKNGWDNDLYEDTELFLGLPREVIIGSKPTPKIAKLPTMEQEIKLYAHRRYMVIISRLPPDIRPEIATEEQMKMAWMIPKVYHAVPTDRNNTASSSQS